MLKAELLLSQLKYREAMREVAAIPPGAASPADLAMPTAVAQSGLNDFAAAEEAASQLKGTDARSSAEVEVALAEVALAARKPADAASHAESALAYFSAHKERDSEFHAAALAAKAERDAGQAEKSTANAKIALDALRSLRDSWVPEDYASYLSRPDATAWSAYVEK